MSERKLGRFQVMALLQAARYYVLTGDLKRAKSFGLNRAIFYAWAKHYGRFRVPARRVSKKPGKEVEKVVEKDKMLIYVGNEGAFVSSRGYFIIGDKEQTPEDYDRQIVSRIDGIVPYEKAWKAAIEYVKSFSKDVLLDQQKFFEKVYKPVRDKFIEVIERREKKTGIEKFLAKKESSS
ncbi:MAG TPA: hypothetical protein ENF87_02800 [Thermoproteales archaeon]|nr:hypothetical protein [Thermoproteales archaeon]